MGSRSNTQNPPPAGPPQSQALDPPHEPPQDPPQNPPQSDDTGWRSLSPGDSPLRTMVVLKPFWESTSTVEGRMVYPARKERNPRGKLQDIPADTIALDLRIAGHRADYERWIHRGQCHDSAVAPPPAAEAAEGEEL